MWILWIVNDHGSPKSVAILCSWHWVVFFSLMTDRGKDHFAPKCEWYQCVPALSLFVNSYRKDLPGEIGHCVMPTGPSAQADCCWSIPCQCYGASVKICDRSERAWTHYTGTPEHGFVREIIDHIQAKCFPLADRSDALQRETHMPNLSGRN